MEAFKKILVSLLFILIGCSTIDSKLAGGAWLLLIIFGLIIWLFKSKERPCVPTLQLITFRKLVRIWLFFTTLALLLKLLGVVYWGEDLSERHAEFRLFLGALGIYGISHMKNIDEYQMHIRLGMIISTSLACLLALVFFILYGFGAAPTNKIPWSGGIALMIIATVGLAGYTQKNWERLLIFISAICGLLAIFLIETRGTYLALLIVPFLMISIIMWSNYNKTSIVSFSKNAGKQLSSIFVLILASVFLVILSPSSILKAPFDRVEVAKIEMHDALNKKDGSFDTSVGARVYMWRESVNILKDKWLFGIGKYERLIMVKNYGVYLNSEVIQSLGHVHNEFLHVILDHGILGISSFLSYTIGLLVIALQLWRKKMRIPSLTFIGLALMHNFAELTNVNFAHNYYPIMLSLSISIMLVSVMISNDNKLQ